jgi:hypothetical protein
MWEMSMWRKRRRDWAVVVAGKRKALKREEGGCDERVRKSSSKTYRTCPSADDGEGQARE